MLSSKFKFLTKRQRSAKGFTLIELLVVIGIIALILAIAVVNYRSANERSRNGRRLADLQQIRSAAEMFRADNPATGYPGSVAAMVPNYLPVTPLDPLSGSNYAYYYRRITSTTYEVCARFEGGTAMCTASGGSAVACGGICGAVGACNCRFVQP